MEFDKIHLKDAIVTWPDMHSFSELDTFGAILARILSNLQNVEQKNIT